MTGRLRRGVLALALTALAGCASAGAGQGAESPPAMSDCEERPVDDADATELGFADAAYRLVWERRCRNGGTRAFAPQGQGRHTWDRLVTLNRYPPGASARDHLERYLARTEGHRAGEPRVFRRKTDDGGERFVAELLLQPPSAARMEYVLHAVDGGGRVVSVTFTYRFSPDGESGLARLKADQPRWLRAVDELLDGFPAP